MSNEDDERLILVTMKRLTNREVLDAYAHWSQMVRALERPNTFIHLENSYAYAKLRRDDHRGEAQRRNLI